MTNEPKCQVCGCTFTKACMTPEGPCHWIREGVLCSACYPKIKLPLGHDEITRAIEPIRGIMIPIDMDATVAFSILALLQLALRHPSFAEGDQALGRFFAKALQHEVSRTPELAAIAEAGWHVKNDLPAVIHTQFTRTL